LEQIAKEIRAIEKDLEPEEREVLRQQPEIQELFEASAQSLPPPAPTPEPPRLAITKRETRLIPAPPGPKKKKLRYHNAFEVNPRGGSYRRR
jgi:hypothetical protein